MLFLGKVLIYTDIYTLIYTLQANSVYIYLCIYINVGLKGELREKNSQSLTHNQNKSEDKMTKQHVKKWLKSGVPINSGKHHINKKGVEFFEVAKNFTVVRK